MSHDMNDNDFVGDAIHTDLCRRAFLGKSAMGIGGFALSGMFGQELQAAMQAGVSSPKATAKRVIMLFMSGGLSQHELFDEKKLLRERRGQELPPSVRGKEVSSQITERQGALAVVGSIFDFKKYGKCGMNMSELLPNIGAMADDLTLIRSYQTDHVLHEAAATTLFTGTPLLGRPSWGSWVSYALGTANKDLPEFVVMLSNGERLAPLHPRLWHSGFLPGKHQGVSFRGNGDPVLYISNPKGVDKVSRRRLLDAVKSLNEIESKRTMDPRVATRIEAYEMAARMQTSVPELADLKKEPKETLERYGATPGKASFANNCLMARRLAERGVRFIQVCDGAWDHHYNIPVALKRKCGQVDKPIGALLKDLKSSGLLDDTIVIMAGEFGRTPFCEGPLSMQSYGRDHNGRTGGAIVAGGGFKKGFTYGKSDDWGWRVVDQPVHVHDLQATVLHCLGFNHEKLVYRHQGRDFRLTDVSGRVVKELLA